MHLDSSTQPSIQWMGCWSTRYQKSPSFQGADSKQLAMPYFRIWIVCTRYAIFLLRESVKNGEMLLVAPNLIADQVYRALEHKNATDKLEEVKALGPRKYSGWSKVGHSAVYNAVEPLFKRLVLGPG